VESYTSAAAAAGSDAAPTDVAPPDPEGDDPAVLAERFEPAGAADLLAWALDRHAGRLALVTSFQAEDMVLLDLAHRLAGGSLDGLLRVVSLDTGRLHGETYELIERVRERFAVDVELIFPDTAAVEALVRHAGPNLFYASPEARRDCCRVRKVEPLARALAPFDAWITGLRRGQSAARQATPKVSPDGDGGRLKLAPIADWSEQRVWRHVREHELPYHPLYDQGYASIGCAPCSRPSRPAEPARAGRWWWEAKDDARECGLHLVGIGDRAPEPPEEARR